MFSLQDHNRGRWEGKGGGKRHSIPHSTQSRGAPPPLPPEEVNSAWGSSSSGTTPSTRKQQSISGGDTWNRPNREISASSRKKPSIGWDTSSWGTTTSLSSGSGWGVTTPSGNSWGSPDWGNNNTTWGAPSSEPTKAGGDSGWGSIATDVGHNGVEARVLATFWGLPTPTNSATQAQNSELRSEPRKKDLADETQNPGSAPTSEDATSLSNWGTNNILKDTKPISLPSRKAIKREASPGPSTVEASEKSRMSSKGTLRIRTESLVTLEPITNILDSAHSLPRREPPLTRNQSYADIIKLIQSAVRLQIKLEDAQANAERWKVTQLSPQYSRASQGTREVLDYRRTIYAQEVTKNTLRLNEVIKALSESLILPGEWKSSPQLDMKQLKLYVNQLKDWVRDLPTHSYLNAPGRHDVPSQPEDSLRQTRQQIEYSLSVLDGLTESIMEQIQLKNYSNLDVDFLDVKTRALLETLSPKDKGQLTNNIEKLLGQADRVGNRLGIVAEPTANLIENFHRDEQLLEQLKAELAEREKAQQQIKLSFRKFEEWQQQDAVRIQQMTERLQSLHTISRPSPPPVNLEELLPEIRTVVVDDLKTEIVTLIERLRAACEQNSNVFVTEIHKKLQPTLDLTNALCNHAQEVVNERTIR